MRWSYERKPAAHGNSRLTLEAVAEIRELKGHLSSGAVGELFGVHRNTVIDIWGGKAWRER
jgi:hypothetical protein